MAEGVRKFIKDPTIQLDMEEFAAQNRYPDQLGKIYRPGGLVAGNSLLVQGFAELARLDLNEAEKEYLKRVLARR